MKGSTILAFSIGLVAGGAVGYFIGKKYRKADKESIYPTAIPPIEESPLSPDEIYAILKSNGYKPSAGFESSDVKEDVSESREEVLNEIKKEEEWYNSQIAPIDRPFEIDDDMYGGCDDEEEEYETLKWAVLADGMVIDESDNLVENDVVIEMVGDENFRDFMLTDDERIYFRNPKKHTDIRIVKAY